MYNLQYPEVNEKLLDMQRNRKMGTTVKKKKKKKQKKLKSRRPRFVN